MATYDAFRPAAAAPRANPISALLARLLEWRDRRDTLKALRALTDHELADIGLARSDVEAMSRA